MNRDFYLYGGFFSGLITGAGLLQSLIYLLLNGQMYGLESFTGWFLVSNMTYLIASIFFLKYYYSKKYHFTFYASIIHIIAVVFLSIVFYNMVAARAINKFYLPSVFVSLAAGVLYGISLIFSRAGERVWLKSAGIVITEAILSVVAVYIL